ncbi:replication initiation protein [Mycobacterium phage MooMoo]|uniref:Helix-turn-helix DNA-binding protein n=1 Tax=Mycobacterium phage MooMoo TaxID=2108127 RepID=A0A2P1JRE7_9CAUD|nr:replication initiation protein [Mycobacterium phage MooMoo]AVO21672.1 helix-turn-helix DNA-binding protein [Mycobacterium phage MooMoo]
MRIRSTKPEFWRSERIASVSWDARLVLKGLESYVDDNGVGKDDIALIVGDVFPRDMLANPRETYARVSEAISELHQAGLLWRYESDGTRLLFVSWWEDIQRIDKPGKGRFRRPDGTMNYRDSEIRESVASPREGVAPGTGEQGNRGTGEKQLLPDADASRDIALIDIPVSPDDYPNDFTPIPETRYSAEFEQWWANYPRKVGKGAAFKAFQAARKRASLDELISGAHRYANDPNREDQFTKYPEGWLRRDGWLDEPLPARNGVNGRNPVAASDVAFAAAQALKTIPSERLELE